MLALLTHLTWPEWRHHPWRQAAALLAVMLGVALAFSVQLINQSALSEFSAAVRSINGQPDFELRGQRGGFDEALYERVAKHPGIALASPVIEVETQALVVDAQGDGNAGTKRVPLRVLGIDALSMRHLASEIGAGTMTLYHYVRTKDELMTLVHDAVMGEVVLPAGETLPPDWRAALTVIANRSRTVMMRHPWMFDITDHPPLGPNSVRHFDQTLEAVCSLDVALLDKLDIISCVDEYVFGYCLQQRNHSSGDPGLPDAMRDYVDSLIATGGYPQLEAMADTSSLEQTWAAIAAHLAEPERFDRNLARLLDGIEAGLPPAAGRS